MPRLTEEVISPDFELTDTQGRLIRLSEYTTQNHVVLVLLRGFV